MLIRVLRVLSVFVLMVVLLACSDALAQRERGGRGGRGGPGQGGFGFGGFGGGGTSTLAFIQRDDVKDEINLSSSQLGKIEALAEGGRGQGRGGFSGFANFRDMSDEERREAFARLQEEREERQQEQREEIIDILNSRQAKRLTELEFQYAVQQGRLASALAIVDIDVDRDKLQDAQRDAAEKIREQMAAIQLKVQSAALAKVLDAEKIEELMGKAFTFEQQQPRRGGFGGGQGRGGFGGRQGRGSNDDRPGRPQRPSGDGNRNPRRDR